MRAIERVAAHLERLGAVEGLLGALAGILAPGRPSPWVPAADPGTLALARELARDPEALPDPLGWAYQAWLARGRRRHGGAYYTEPAVVRYLCRRALAGLPARPRVLDPACGSGAFLLGAAAEEADAVLEGWDRDATAAAICQWNLARAGVPAAVQVQDSLAVAASPGGSFDVVVGNPPYISSGLRGARRVAPEEHRELRARFPGAAQYKLNTYPLFVAQGLRLLRPGGRLAYILPDSFLLGRFFAGLRRELLATGRILEVTLLDRDCWQDGIVGRPVLLVVEKGAPPPGHAVQVRLSTGTAGLEAPVAARRQPQAEWAAGVLQRFRLLFRDSDAALVRALEAHPRVRPLGAVLGSYSGLIARAGQRSLLRSAGAAGRPGPWAPLLRSGREIDRYTLRWGGEQVLLDPALIKSGGRLELYRAPKVLLRQTGDDLRAVYDDQGFFCLNNIHLLVPTLSVGPAALPYCLALLNSRLLNRYYRLLTLEEGRAYAQVDLDLLGTLPLRVPAPDDPADQRLFHRVTELVRQRQGCSQDQAPALEQALEDLVEELYGVKA